MATSSGRTSSPAQRRQRGTSVGSRGGSDPPSSAIRCYGTLSTAEDETLRLREGVEREMGVRRERERTASRERAEDDGYGL